MAVMAHLMEKDFEDMEDLTKFRVAIAQAFTDNVMEKGIVLGDETEKAVLLSIKEMIQKEAALQQVKNELRSTDPF
jgi:activator of 2-hydroxyglutaryl-CoA dehydratase